MRVSHARFWLHMYVCSHVPTRCSPLGRSARQNSAQPYYLRFVSWLQTITHFPLSSHLSPFPSLWALCLSYSPLYLSLFLSLHRLPLPSPLTPASPFTLSSFYSRPRLPSLPLRLSLSLSPFLFSSVTLRFPFMTVHRAQLRNGFIIELPSAMNLILF